MSTQSHPYQPDQRLIDNRRKLHSLYIEQDLTCHEIADEHASVGHSRVHDKLVEHGIIELENENTDQQNSERGTDPPQDKNRISWTDIQ